MSFATYNVNAIVDAKAFSAASTAPANIVPDTGVLAIFNDSTASASGRLAWKRDDGFSVALNTPVSQNTVYTLPSSAAALTLVDSTVQTLSSLSTVGTIGTGTWQGSLINSTYGGTGVNNGGRTVTIAGNFTTAGANPLTLTTTGVTNVTLPTTGTLVNTAVTTLSSLSSIGTITTGVWNGTTIAVANGGTGATTLAPGGLLYGNGTSAVAASVGTSGQLLVSGAAGAPTWSGGVTYSGSTITGLGTPSANTDAATKLYVDQSIAGLSWKQAARVASTVALTVTYANGTAGLGATLTNAGVQAALVIDSVTLAVNDRVLIKDQASAIQNGIYLVTNVGSGATNWILTRASDADNSPNNELDSAAIFVSAGTVGANKSWVQTTAAPVLGTSNILWSQFSGTNTYTATGGITLSGNNFQITANNLATLYGGTGITSYAAGDLLYGTAGSALTKLTAGTATQVLHSGATPSWGAVSLTADVAGTLPIANGGTNSATALNNNRIMVSSGGAIVEAAALTNGQLLIGSTGAAPVAASITGTANRVTVAVGAGTITLSGPQDIATTSTPTFASEFLTATTNQLVLGTTNTTTISATAPAASSVYTIPDVGTSANFVMTAGNQTIAGNKTLSGTTNLSSLTASLPLVLDASKNIVAQQVNLTTQVQNVLPIANGGTALSTTPTNGQLLIGNGTNYTLSTITAGAGVTVVNGSGTITISSSAATAPQTVSIVNAQFTVTNTAAAALGYVPYSNSRYGAFGTRTVRFWVVPGSVDRTLTVQILPNGGTALVTSPATVLVAAGGSPSLQSFTFTAPVADTRLDFAAFRSAGGSGTSPVVFGATIEFS